LPSLDWLPLEICWSITDGLILIAPGSRAKRLLISGGGLFVMANEGLLLNALASGNVGGLLTGGPWAGIGRLLGLVLVNPNGELLLF
jgi:hypothetical protein